MSQDPDPIADADVATAFDALSRGDAVDARALLDAGLRAHPLDSRFQVMSAALAELQGDPGRAIDHLWRGLAAEPQSALARAELVRMIVSPMTDAHSGHKDFALDSGERQTGTSVGLIRADHRARYAMAARWLRQHRSAPRRLAGLDVFCGNGYGSRMLSDLAGVRMFGVDGSAPAVAMAEQVFGTHRAVFGHAVFPFALSAGQFDFAVCFESLAHVDDPVALLTQLAQATRGPLMVSVPHEGGLPMARLRPQFKHHVRHFERAEVVELLARVGRRRIVAEYGQHVYEFNGDTVRGMVPEARMGLTPFDPQHSQFLVLVVDVDDPSSP